MHRPIGAHRLLATIQNQLYGMVLRVCEAGFCVCDFDRAPDKPLRRATPPRMGQMTALSGHKRRGLTCHDAQVRRWIVREGSDAKIKTVLAP